MNVVLLEDTAAVAGVGVALSCLGLTSVMGTTIPDAVGSCVIGGILASVSAFIIYSNVAALVGRCALCYYFMQTNSFHYRYM